MYNNIEAIKNYFNGKEVSIFCFNDSQIRSYNNPFSKPFPDIISEILKKNGLNVVNFNFGSSYFNKTSDINNFLEANLTYDQYINIIKSGENVAFSKIIYDISPIKSNNENKFKIKKLSFEKVSISYIISKFLKNSYDPNAKDKKITTTLEDSKTPIILYSSGVNDIMNYVFNNPFKYKEKNKDGTIPIETKYTKKRLEDESIEKYLEEKIRSNFDNFYSINKNSKIFALSIYMPKSVESKNPKIFNDAVERYNSVLRKLCNEYNINFVDIKQIGYENSDKKYDFHVNAKGHEIIANKVLEILSNSLDKKMICNNPNLMNVTNSIEALAQKYIVDAKSKEKQNLIFVDSKDSQDLNKNNEYLEYIKNQKSSENLTKSLCVVSSMYNKIAKYQGKIKSDEELTKAISTMEKQTKGIKK